MTTREQYPSLENLGQGTLARPDLQTVQRPPYVREFRAVLGKAPAVILQVWDAWRSQNNTELKKENTRH